MVQAKVLVALSGGVDSAVAAKLLQQKGYYLEGAFMRLTDNENFEEGWSAAQAIARQLNFPLRVFDFRQVFLEKVINPVLDSYRQGLTPNPCVLCNDRIKFGYFWREAKKLGFDFIATGHYVKKKKKRGAFQLWQAEDKAKDQSYFLWLLDQERLPDLLFPLGSYLRSTVEDLAKQWGIIQFTRPASQELCFVKGKMDEFLKNTIGEKEEGAIIDSQGNLLGKHRGLWFYTIGQRRNLDLAGGPFYVIGKNIERNQLIVSLDKQDLLKKEFLLQNVHWLSGSAPVLFRHFLVKIRYLALAQKGVLKREGSFYRCFSLQKAVTPGQSVAIYQGERLLGGGIIVN